MTGQRQTRHAIDYCIRYMLLTNGQNLLKQQNLNPNSNSKDSTYTITNRNPTKPNHNPKRSYNDQKTHL